MPAAVRVAVCTNRRPADVAACFAALRGQVSDEHLAVVTSGLDESAVAAHREAFGDRILVERETGLSRARNRAIEWCADDEVLAFVDDDAIVAEGWHAALTRRWAEAPEDIGCIGGPIRPRYAVPPPPWLSDPILPALTLLDLGPRVRDLDPAVTTVYGANISFRAGALRAAGGFDPALGHRAGRIFFSEEDEAQRALARLGYRTRYVPDAVAWHVIPAARLTRRAFLRRRFAYGATLGVRGARPRRAAARQALSSAAGCVAAAAARDGALFMERAVRAAENVGALLGPVVGRRRSRDPRAPAR